MGLVRIVAGLRWLRSPSARQDIELAFDESRCEGVLNRGGDGGPGARLSGDDDLRIASAVEKEVLLNVAPVDAIVQTYRQERA